MVALASGFNEATRGRRQTAAGSPTCRTRPANPFYALANGIYGTVPFLALFQIGFLHTGLLSIIQ